MFAWRWSYQYSCFEEHSNPYIDSLVACFSRWFLSKRLILKYQFTLTSKAKVEGNGDD